MLSWRTNFCLLSRLEGSCGISYSNCCCMTKHSHLVILNNIVCLFFLVSREWIERVPPENILRVLICLRMLMRDHVFQVQSGRLPIVWNYAGCSPTQPGAIWFTKRLCHELRCISQFVLLPHFCREMCNGLSRPKNKLIKFSLWLAWISAVSSSR